MGAFIQAENSVSGITNSAALKNVALAFGGIKGGAVAMMIETLSAVLSNGNFGSNAETVNNDGQLQGPSHFVLAIDPEKFGSRAEEFSSNMAQYVADIKATSTAVKYP